VKRIALVSLVSLVSFVSLVWPGPIGAVPGKRIEYGDLPAALQRRWASKAEFTAYVRDVETDTDRRVADGEREHLIHYALQSAVFTTRPRIEPAISSLAFVNALSQAERDRLVEDPAYVPNARWPPDERARVVDLLNALRKGPTDARLAYFRKLLRFDAGAPTAESLYPDYVRVVRFLYRKEFLAGGDAATISRSYQSRAHSSDTQIEAGLGVYLGLGTLRALESSPRIRSVVVIGPGLDLAPRTDLVDAVPPQSYQPFAVADALLRLSLSTESQLSIRSVDVNPRVVQFLQAVGRAPITLHLFTGVAETADTPFSAEYRAYLNELGRAIGQDVAAPRRIATDGRYRRSILVRSGVRQAISAERLNIITERPAAGDGADLVIATNVLSYFDDRQLALALANIAASLRPGGYLLHNESREGLVELAGAVGLPVLQMRTAVLGGPAARPLYDSIWLHRKP